MGLLIKLQDGDTALKSLKFGNDRPGGGDSGQPYIKNPIEGTNSPANKDFLLRGGINTPLDAAEDVARLTKYFFDFRNPSGLLFTAKQNLLSRTAVKAEVADKTIPNNSPGPAYGGGTINEGIYTPLSTIAEAGVVAFGGHLNKQGLDPTGLLPTLSIKKYGPTAFVLNESQNNEWFASPAPLPNFTYQAYSPPSRFDTPEASKDLSFSNRLLRLWYTKELPKIGNNSTLLSYSGGPGSTLGFGTTDINFATLGDGLTPSRTGVNNNLFASKDIKIQEKFLKGGTTPLSQRWYINYTNGIPKYEETKNVANFIGASQKYGLSKNEIWAGNVDEDSGYLYSINLDKYLTSTNGYNPRSKEQRKDSTKWILPVGASLKYNSFSKDSTNNQISKDNSVLQQKIDDLKAQQDEINKKRNDPEQYTYQETTFTNLPDGKVSIKTKGESKYTEDEIKNIQSSYSQQWLALDKQIKELETQIRQPNNDDYSNSPIKIITSDNTDGLYKGDISYKLVIPNNSVYNPDSLTKRNDIKEYNTFTQKQIDSFSSTRKTPTYDIIDEVTRNNVNRIYYDSTTDGKRQSKELFTDYNDLIEFNFTIIDPQNPSSPGTVLDFRAYIDQFSDSYSNDWKSQTYVGRAEKQYKYNSFDRSISLGFTIVADNETNLKQMYSQLNTLASSIAPSYTKQGYMAGVLHKLTVGNYINRQPGILQGLTFEITDETPWQISKGSQLPLYIKVTGIKFTPIHNFRPEVILDSDKADNADYNVPVLIDDQRERYIYQSKGDPNS